MKRLLSLVLLGSPAFLKAMEGRQTTPADSTARLFTTLDRARYANNDAYSEEVNIEEFRHIPTENDKRIYKSILEHIPDSLKDIIYDEQYPVQCESRLNVLFLVGRPGTSKSTSAQAIAHELGQAFFVGVPDIKRKHRNATGERLLAIINAIAKQPIKSILIIDEINKLTNNYASEYTDADETGTVLWKCIDAQMKNPNFFLIGTANENKKMHQQLQDRFKGSFVTLLPANDEQRKEFILDYLKYFDEQIKIPKDTSVNEAYLGTLVEKTNEFTHRDLQQLMLLARRFTLSSHRKGGLLVITAGSLDQALEHLQRQIEEYCDFSEQIPDEERRHKETLEANKKHHEESIEVSKQAQTLSDQHFVQGQQFQVDLHTNLETTQVQGGIGIVGGSSSSQKIKKPDLTYANLSNEQKQYLRNR